MGLSERARIAFDGQLDVLSLLQFLEKELAEEAEVLHPFVNALVEEALHPDFGRILFRPFPGFGIAPHIGWNAFFVIPVGIVVSDFRRRIPRAGIGTVVVKIEGHRKEAVQFFHRTDLDRIRTGLDVDGPMEDVVATHADPSFPGFFPVGSEISHVALHVDVRIEVVEVAVHRSTEVLGFTEPFLLSLALEKIVTAQSLVPIRSEV